MNEIVESIILSYIDEDSKQLYKEIKHNYFLENVDSNKAKTLLKYNIIKKIKYQYKEGYTLRDDISLNQFFLEPILKQQNLNEEQFFHQEILKFIALNYPEDVLKLAEFINFKSKTLNEIENFIMKNKDEILLLYLTKYNDVFVIQDDIKINPEIYTFIVIKKLTATMNKEKAAVFNFL